MAFVPFRPWVILLLALGLLADATGRAFAQERTTNAEAELLTDVRDGRLEQFEFIDAALIAGGINEPHRRAELLRLRDDKYATVDFAAIRKLPSQDRPAALLAQMHRQILMGKFRPTATLVQETLATGDFNCVTATILYHDLCSRASVSVEIVAQSGHVCSRLVNSGWIIETTRYEADDDVQFRETLSALPSNRNVRAIKPSELLGRIYYNRALAALEKQKFESAIGLLRNSLTCDPQDRDAQENLLAGLNNWALALSEKGDYAAATQRIATGLSLNAVYQPLLSNDLHIHQQWVAHLCREEEFAQALQVLEAGKSRRPDAPLFANGQRAVYEAWLKHCNSTGDSQTAAQVLRQAQEQLGPQVKLAVEAKPKPKVISAKSRSEAGGQ